ncbi:hypothetical protein ABMA27_009753 [Loxostege sticticalis]|uniref:Peptidase S1 domain-containing protein n=1 Tax=Loxostege sticticalis TaxID=481309 RepID=A0ABR3H6C7_LOXSC
MKLLRCIVLISFLSCVYAYETITYNETCPRPDETCMHYEQCPQDIQDLLKMENKPREVLQQLRSAMCGKRILKKLCCKTQQPPPPQPECYTWDGRPGTCVEYSKFNNRSMTTRQQKISICKKRIREGRFICHSNSPVKLSTECEVSAFPSDPSHGCCGIEKVAGSKIIGGVLAAIEQFPWLAVIKYDEDVRNCSGALISHRYVLTAAHCVDYTSPQPYAVVLGEYDKSTKKDCDDRNGCHETEEDEQTIGIEEIIVHKSFDPSSNDGRNDIALIRLNRMATFSDFVQPICLPMDNWDITKRPPASFELWSSGWGDVNPNYPSPSDVKRKIQLPFVDPMTCVRSVSRLWSLQMCAGGEYKKDSCSGDSGSPLMYDRNGTFEMLGITSHGVTKCGTNGVPAIYTKVFSYLNWIHSNIRP